MAPLVESQDEIFTPCNFIRQENRIFVPPPFVNFNHRWLAETEGIDPNSVDDAGRIIRIAKKLQAVHDAWTIDVAKTGRSICEERDQTNELLASLPKRPTT